MKENKHMKTTTNSGDKHGVVTVKSNSLLAHFAEYKSRRRQIAIAGLGENPGKALYFVENEVIVSGSDNDLLRKLVRDHNGVVVESRPLIAPPSNLKHRRRDYDPATLPKHHVVRFAAPPRINTASREIEQLLGHRGFDVAPMGITSEMALGVAALVARESVAASTIGLNVVGETITLPLLDATENFLNDPSQSDPFDWPEYSGWTRVVDAWQLVESFRTAHSVDLVKLAVLDSGFWLDPSTADFVGAMGINLISEGAGYGAPNAIDSGKPWHGGQVASVAAGKVDSKIGVAGSGGTVAMPIMFRTSLSVHQVFCCLEYCCAWGIDVLNMSVEISLPTQFEPFVPMSIWVEEFLFASSIGDVVIIAAAGNDGANLPNDRFSVPATRTPGVVTVGALEVYGPNSVPLPASYSNYGPSVHIWAPGSSIHVAPDPANLGGSLQSGTSLAAPIVSGVAAMMRAVSPGLPASEITSRLINSGWLGQGRISRGLDAFRAVFAAMDDKLPDSNEPNDNIANARFWPTNVPIVAILSTSSDRDLWRFEVTEYVNIEARIDWYHRLSHYMFFQIEGEPTSGRAIDELTTSGDQRQGFLEIKGVLPPGSYRVVVDGDGPTAYELIVRQSPMHLEKDIFEENDSFESASELRFKSPQRGPFGGPGPFKTWGPGSYDATIHEDRMVLGGEPPLVISNENADFFTFTGIDAGKEHFAQVLVSDSDFPLTATLFDAGRAEIWSGTKQEFDFRPEPSKTYYLKLECDRPNRYRIAAHLWFEPPSIPQQVPEVPDWWDDPHPNWLKERITHFGVNVDWAVAGDLHFATPRGAAVSLELIGPGGQVQRVSERIGERLIVPTRGLKNGSYLLRATRDGDGRAALQVLPPSLAHLQM